MKQFLLSLFILIGGLVTAQTVSFNESIAVSSLMDRYIDNNANNPKIKGWRIQIVSTSDRREMEKARSKFSRLYPFIESSWNHVVPYYQVRVGAYEDKTTLMAFLVQLKKDFPTATPVVDQINKTEFVR